MEVNRFEDLLVRLAEVIEVFGITVELGKMYGSYGKHMKYPEKLYEKELF